MFDERADHFKFQTQRIAGAPQFLIFQYSFFELYVGFHGAVSITYVSLSGCFALPSPALRSSGRGAGGSLYSVQRIERVLASVSPYALSRKNVDSRPLARETRDEVAVRPIHPGSARGAAMRGGGIAGPDEIIVSRKVNRLGGVELVE